MKVAPFRLAPVRTAPEKLTLANWAVVRLAPVSSAPEKITLVNLAVVRFGARQQRAGEDHVSESGVRSDCSMKSPP